MKLCVIGLPFDFCFSFIKNVSTFRLSLIALAAGVGAIVITFVQKKYSEVILKKTCK